MTKIKYRKWNVKINSRDSLASIVTQSLQYRIAAVRYYLRLAAKKPHEDIEYVHQLRTWSMRSMVALQFYSESLPKKKTAKLIKHLKKIREAAGNARDYDVLIKKYKLNTDNQDNQRFLKFLQEKRERSQAPIEKIYRKFEKGKRLSEQVDKMKQSLHSHTSLLEKGKASNFEHYAKSRLQPLVTKYFESNPCDINDLEGLHKFRINGKTLRYAMELTAFAFPQKFKNEIYPEIGKLQANLGVINDSAMLIRLIHYWVMTTAENEIISVFEQVYEHEEAHLKTELDSFKAKWRLENLNSLQMKFDNILFDIHSQAVA